MSNELKVEGKLDLSKANTLSLAKAASDPGGASEGDVYYNTVDLVVRIFQNGAWQNLIASPDTTNLPQIEIFILSNTDITNKFIELSNTPSNPVKTQVNVIGGISQAYGSDFILIGNQVGWNGLFLDGVLSAGDRIVVQHD